jgi:REP element-mobilizing transposase RayT
MPRRARIHLPGLPLHIVQRGHNREACFFSEDDYLRAIGDRPRFMKLKIAVRSKSTHVDSECSTQDGPFASQLE